MNDCVFCGRIQGDDLIVENELAVAFLDGFPVNPGHVLIVPRRHEPDFFALSEAEQAAIWTLVPAVRSLIERDHSPDGYNVGINANFAAGQTVDHAHLHVIPRYKGDVDDPRGGIRWVIPERARYWTG